MQVMGQFALTRPACSSEAQLPMLGGSHDAQPKPQLKPTTLCRHVIPPQWECPREVEGPNAIKAPCDRHPVHQGPLRAHEIL